MTKDSIADFKSVINKQIGEREILDEILLKTEALLEAAFSDVFLDRDKLIIHNYFWVVSDFIIESRKINQKLLHELMLLLHYENKIWALQQPQ